MSLKTLLIVVLVASASIFVLSQREDGDCVASASPISYCSQTIYSNCKNARFISNRLTYGDNCSSVSLFWDAPMYNMTILFESHLTKPYAVCIEPVGCTEAYRTLDDGREVSIEWDTFKREPVCFKTTRADRPTMKFRFDAGSEWHCYGSFIRVSYRY